MYSLAGKVARNKLNSDDSLPIGTEEPAEGTAIFPYYYTKKFETKTQ